MQFIKVVYAIVSILRCDIILSAGPSLTDDKRNQFFVTLLREHRNIQSQVLGQLMKFRDH